MKALGEKIVSYWNQRAEGYSEYNQEELSGNLGPAWLEEIEKNLPPGKTPEEIHVLDVGTGPGYFAILLAQNGYHVTGVDCTEQMLVEAKNNAGKYADKIAWGIMDAQELNFPDNTFDLIVTRNLTWVLEEPEKAYQEWFRVLKTGGVLVNFDANWYRYLYDEEMRKGYEADRAATKEQAIRDEYVDTDIDAMEEIARKVPLSQCERPLWDKKVLSEIGFTQISVDETVWERVWNPEEKVNYASTPMFRIGAVKSKK